MTDQPSGFETQPPGHHAAAAAPAQPAAPPRRGWGILRALLFLFAMFGMVAFLFVAGIFALYAFVASSGEDWIDEVHY